MSARLFISYSSQDAQHRSDLIQHLRLADAEHKVEPWWDEKIPPGEPWESCLASALANSRLFVPLVSNTFLQSVNCEREWKRAVELAESGELRVLPVILEDCSWKDTPLNAYQCLPNRSRPICDWSDPEDAWAYTAKKIVTGVTTQSPSPASNLPHHVVNVNVEGRNIEDTEIVGARRGASESGGVNATVDVKGESIRNSTIIGTHTEEGTNETG